MEMRLTMTFALFSAGACLLLQGCTSSVDAVDSPPELPQDAAGIYTGLLRTPDYEEPVEVTVFAADRDSKRIVVFGDVENVVASGIYAYDGGGIDVNARLFQEPEPELEEEVVEDEAAPSRKSGRKLSDERMTTFFATGRHTNQSGFSVNFVTENNTTGSIQVRYSAERYERMRTLSDVSGLWETRDQFGTATASLVVDQGGSISGQDENCTYSGELSQPNIRFNLYELRLSIQCGNDASETDGLATLVEATDEVPERLQMVSASSTLAHVMTIFRAD